MSTQLLKQQQALLAALWSPRHEDACALLGAGKHVDGPHGRWQRGLEAYRSNGQELARRALAGAYPVVCQLLGDDNFQALASMLWQRDPPDRGDMALWGATLPALIESLDDLVTQEPYLPDVARAEWALHQAATSADREVDADSFNMLAVRDPGQLTLVLAPGTGCVSSRFPLASIINARLDDLPTLEEAGRRVREGARESVVIWRQGRKPRLREAAAGECAFLGALQEKRPLADSLQAAPALDFREWLPAAVQSGLLLCVAAL